MEGTPLTTAKQPKKEPENKNKGIKVSVSLDMKAEDVLHLDAEGYSLCFPGDPEKLVQMTDDQYRELSYDNRVAYGVALALSKELEKRKDEPKPMLGEIKAPMAASATRRLDLIGVPKGWHYCWKRPDELHEASLSGYSLAGDEVKSYATRVGTTHRVTALGNDELVLMRIPQDQFEAIEREAGERSRRSIDSQANKAKEAIEKIGGIPFEPSEKDGRSWQESKREEMTSG